MITVEKFVVMLSTVCRHSASFRLDQPPSGEQMAPSMNCFSSGWMAAKVCGRKANEPRRATELADIDVVYRYLLLGTQVAFVPLTICVVKIPFLTLSKSPWNGRRRISNWSGETSIHNKTRRGGKKKHFNMKIKRYVFFVVHRSMGNSVLVTIMLVARLCADWPALRSVLSALILLAVKSKCWLSQHSYVMNKKSRDM